MPVSKKIKEMYLILSEGYGPQGWWPIMSKAGAKGFDSRGYHKGIYDYPRTRSQRFEVVAGSVLTQNTSWKNVEKALGVMHSEGLVSPEKILGSKDSVLAGKIRAAGYYNQKAKKLKGASKWFLDNDSRISGSGDSENEIKTAREALLKVNGVGPETADSILLYAYRKPIFVVDAYTRRIFQSFNFYNPDAVGKNEYDHLQGLVHKAFRNERDKTKIFNEFHALIVERGKFEGMVRKRTPKPKKT